jgi:hypothetical protein
MPVTLEYAPSKPTYTRYAVFLLTAGILIVSYVLAIPSFKQFRQQQIRRDEIRRQFKDELQAARDAIGRDDYGSAASALLHAEFATRTERLPVPKP